MAGKARDISLDPRLPARRSPEDDIEERLDILEATGGQAVASGPRWAFDGSRGPYRRGLPSGVYLCPWCDGLYFGPENEGPLVAACGGCRQQRPLPWRRRDPPRKRSY